MTEGENVGKRFVYGLFCTVSVALYIGRWVALLVKTSATDNMWKGGYSVVGWDIIKLPEESSAPPDLTKPSM